MSPPDPNITPVPPIRAWKGGAWPVIAAAVVLLGAYATLAVMHEQVGPKQPPAAVARASAP